MGRLVGNIHQQTIGSPTLRGKAGNRGQDTFLGNLSSSPDLQMEELLLICLWGMPRFLGTLRQSWWGSRKSKRGLIWLPRTRPCFCFCASHSRQHKNLGFSPPLYVYLFLTLNWSDPHPCKVARRHSPTLSFTFSKPPRKAAVGGSAGLCQLPAILTPVCFFKLH